MKALVSPTIPYDFSVHGEHGDSAVRRARGGARVGRPPSPSRVRVGVLQR